MAPIILTSRCKKAARLPTQTPKTTEHIQRIAGRCDQSISDPTVARFQIYHRGVENIPNVHGEEPSPTRRSSIPSVQSATHTHSTANVRSMNESHAATFSNHAGRESMAIDHVSLRCNYFKSSKLVLERY